MTDRLAHDFMLTLEGADFDDDEVVDDLYEAGCDDGLLIVDPKGKHHIWFTREADSLQEAMDSAVADVESVSGVVVVASTTECGTK